MLQVNPRPSYFHILHPKIQEPNKIHRRILSNARRIGLKLNCIRMPFLFYTNTITNIQVEVMLLRS